VKEAVPYNSVREKIKDGDTFLVLNQSLYSLATLAITISGRNNASHAGKLAWWGRGRYRRLMALETREWRGGRALHFSQVVANHPGGILIRRIQQRPYNVQKAIEAMINITGKPYGWWNLIKAAMLHLPVTRLFAKWDLRDTSNGSLPFCSQAVARADRAGGVDPVPHLADRLTEPGDLARSAAYRDMFVIFMGDCLTGCQVSLQAVGPIVAEVHSPKKRKAKAAAT